LFDKDSVVIGEFINHSNGNVESNVATFLSSYIQVKPSTQYVFNPFLITYVLYDVDKNYITGADGQSGFTTTSNSYYVRFRNSTSLGGNMSQSLLDSQNAQLEQGTTATTYEPYRKSKKTYLGAFRKLDETTYDEFNEEQKTTRVGYVESIDDELVGYNGKTLRDVFGDSSNVQSVGKNLFDLEAFKTFLNTKASTSNAYIDGVILNAKAAGGVNFVPFDFLNFKPLTQYTLKMDVREVTTDQEIRFRIYYDDGTYTQLIAAPLTTSFATFSATSTAGKTVTYMTLVYSYPSQYELRNIQLEQGTTATAYEPYIDIDILVNDWSLYYEGVLKHLYDPDDIFGTNEPTLEEFESLLHAYELLQAGESSARYLLPEPIVEPIQTSGDTHLLSYPNSFITQTSLLTNLEKYTTQITFSYPIEKLNKLIILNGDGTQTNLDTSLATIAIDNLSLTHPDLTLNDFIYYEATVKDSLNYTDLNFTFYKDSKVVVDSVTSDLIKWHVKASNGVLSLEGDIV
jgi:hypothetical protein